VITYYSDTKSIKNIHNPLVDNSTEMRSSGFFEIVENNSTPYFGTSLKKTLHNQGRIFCDDASKLFSISRGYVGLVMSFPLNLQNGVLSNIRYSDKEFMLWAANMGQTDIESSGIGVFLTKNGIEFRVKTSAGDYSLTDNETTIFAEQSFEIEFLWDKDGISIIESNPTMLIRVNNVNTFGGIVPIIDDSDINSAFYAKIGQDEPSGTNVFDEIVFQILDNYHELNNLSCSVSRIMIEDSIPVHFSEGS